MSKKVGLDWPEANPNRKGMLMVLSDRLFYSYINPILKKGSELHQLRQTSSNESSNDEISLDELFDAPATMKSDYLNEKFNTIYLNKGISQAERRKSSIYVTNKSKPLGWTFVKALLELCRSTYVPAGLYQLVTVIVQSLTPMIVQRLLILFENNPVSSIAAAGGVPLAMALFFISVVESVVQERNKFLSFQSGITVRAAAMNAIYNQMLQMPLDGNQSLKVGEVTTLVAVDCQKLFEVFQEGHMLWSCPLSIIIVTVLLSISVGKAAIVGVLFMIANVPIIEIIISRMARMQRNRASFTDRRVEVTTSMLNAMRFCKLNNYEEKFLERLDDARKSELIWVHKVLSMIGWIFTIIILSPVIAGALTFITYALIDGGNVLTPSKTFTTLLLFATLRQPINSIGRILVKLAQGIEASNRIALFLQKDVRKSICDGPSSRNPIDNGSLVIRNANFTVGKITQVNGTPQNQSNHALLSADEEIELLTSKIGFVVCNVSLTVRKSEVHCIVGKVGSGKSSLINGIIGEISSTPSCNKEPMHIVTNGRIVLASQTPFIMNANIRENILFGESYNVDLYNSVLEACGLLPDLQQLPNGDLTEIGARGVTLSGGQKARISIARCVYAQPDIALFDDVLSALDASTSKMIFESLFDVTKKDRLLSNSAVILVTHATHFLSRVDNIMVLDGGRTIYCGHWNGMKSVSEDANQEVLKHLYSCVQEVNDAVPKKLSDIDRNLSEDKQIHNNDQISPSIEHKEGLASNTEKRTFGLCDIKTWLSWFKLSGASFSSFTLLLLSLDRALFVLTELWLAKWTSAENKPVEVFGITFPAQSAGIPSVQHGYIKVYVLILALSFLATSIRTQMIIQGGAICSKKVFEDVANCVIHATISYFETTPTGQILNKLTSDVDILDINLSSSMSILITSVGWIVTGLLILLIILPYSAFVLAPIITLNWLLLLYYRKSAVDLQRLDAVSRSPVQTKFNEAMEGNTTIAVFSKFSHFQTQFKTAVDKNTSAMMNYMVSQRWLGVRVLMIGSLLILFVTITPVVFNDRLKLEAGFIGMLIMWTLGFNHIFSMFSQAMSETEANMTSLERLKIMTQLQQENDVQISTLDPKWPHEGSISFEKVCLRYRSDLPLALNELSFSVSPGQRVGICGRTGAGKSTLAGPALFRLCELESGKIILDGEDLSKISLADVRGRKNGMYIISQDPVLFSGSLRESLDPWSMSTDEEIMEALKSVEVADAERRGIKVLDEFVEEGGSNFSIGERQLLCLVRAVLAKPKVLFLDEATASVDAATDASIQNMIRKKFKGTTLLTIAHRLDTIMDYDIILVLDKGKVAELGTPLALLGLENGIFKMLVDSTGKENSLLLRRMAENAATPELM